MGLIKSLRRRGLMACMSVASIIAVSFLPFIPFHAVIAMDSALEEKVADEIAELNWIVGDDVLVIDEANGSIQLNASQLGVTGSDAQQFLKLAEGHNNYLIHAAVLGSDDNFETEENIVIHYYQYKETGYSKLDDWHTVDSKELYNLIEKNTQKDNETKAPGYPKIFLDGWIQEPFLDRTNKTVFFAFAAHTDQGAKLVNARAIILGKKGYVLLTWVGFADKFSSASASLTPAIRAFAFNSGHRYADFQPGVDEVSALGIGSLVYKIIAGDTSTKTTSKAVGTGLLALLIIFLKKGGFLLMIVPLALWVWIKKRIRRE